MGRSNSSSSTDGQGALIDGIFHMNRVALWRIGRYYIAAADEEEALSHYSEETGETEEEARVGGYPEKVSRRDMNRFTHSDSEHELVSPEVGHDPELSWRAVLELRLRAGESIPFTFATSVG